MYQHSFSTCYYFLVSPQAAIEAQLRHRLDLQGAHKSYLEFKAKKLQAEKEEEEVFRQQMMAKFAEDDRIEQMNAQRRRMKQLGKMNNIISVPGCHTAGGGGGIPPGSVNPPYHLCMSICMDKSSTA